MSDPRPGVPPAAAAEVAVGVATSDLWPGVFTGVATVAAIGVMTRLFDGVLTGVLLGDLAAGERTATFGVAGLRGVLSCGGASS